MRADTQKAGSVVQEFVGFPERSAVLTHPLKGGLLFLGEVLRVLQQHVPVALVLFGEGLIRTV